MTIEILNAGDAPIYIGDRTPTVTDSEKLKPSVSVLRVQWAELLQLRLAVLNAMLARLGR